MGEVPREGSVQEEEGAEEDSIAVYGNEEITDQPGGDVLGAAGLARAGSLPSRPSRRFRVLALRVVHTLAYCTAFGFDSGPPRLSTFISVSLDGDP